MNYKKKNKKWARYHNTCIICNTHTTPHQAKGMCYNCYHRINGLNGKWIKENPEFHKTVVNIWDSKHREYRRLKAKERYHRLKKEVPNFKEKEKERVKLYKIRKSDKFLIDDINNLSKRINQIKKNVHTL